MFFILGVFLMLGAAWAVFPAEGVRSIRCFGRSSVPERRARLCA